MNETLATHLAAATREARVRAGLSQAHVARALGLSPLVYARLERGKLLPGTATLRRLSAMLHTPADVLLATSPPDEALSFEEDELETAVRGLVSAFRAASAPQRRALGEIINALLDSLLPVARQPTQGE